MSYTEQGYDVPDAGSILVDGFGNFFKGGIDNGMVFVIVFILLLVLFIAIKALRR